LGEKKKGSKKTNPYLGDGRKGRDLFPKLGRARLLKGKMERKRGRIKVSQNPRRKKEFYHPGLHFNTTPRIKNYSVFQLRKNIGRKEKKTGKAF